jgi:type IV pilus assembly protein PilB
MGIDPYLIAPTLQLALAQRLVRRICPGTGKKVPIEGSVKAMIDVEFNNIPDNFKSIIPKADYVLYAEPTAECTSGTRGRVAVMEAIRINDQIEHLILGGADDARILEEARKIGYITMKEEALEHTIPFEEISTLGGALLASDEAEEEAERVKALPPVDNQEAEAQ